MNVRCHFNTFKSILVAEIVLETVKSACPGHSAPFQLGDLGGITVLRLRILPVEKKTARKKGMHKYRRYLSCLQPAPLCPLRGDGAPISLWENHPALALSLGPSRGRTPSSGWAICTHYLPSHCDRYKDGTRLKSGQLGAVRLHSPRF